MSTIKKLAGQTAIYGLSSIVGRFLNYLLVPLHTLQFSTNQYGIITEMYAYVAFLVVLLTYGMETTFFRFTSKTDHKLETVYKTILTSLLSTTALFIVWATIFSQGIADWLHYPNNQEFVVWFAVIVGLDAVSSIPLAKLRHQNKALKFAGVNLLNVAINIGLNLFFLGYCMPHFQAGDTNIIIDTLYTPEIGVGYVFISNLIASIVKFLVLTPMMKFWGSPLSKRLLKEMLWFGVPLLIAGLAGITNETIDRIMLKTMLFDTLGEKDTMSQLGIYGANYKISIIITLFIQAFRYAAEPFFFSQEKNKNAKETYAKVMNYFVAVVAIIFLGVMYYLELIKYFIPNSEFWGGLAIVPILLFANIFLGIYYNQSIWYKLTNKTKYGAYIAIIGALITVVANYILIPKYGYVGSAWATLVCYFIMVFISYLWGNKHYPVKYNLIRIFGYLTLAVVLWQLALILGLQNDVTGYLVKTVLLLCFVGAIIKIENPFKNGKQAIN